MVQKTSAAQFIERYATHGEVLADNNAATREVDLAPEAINDFLELGPRQQRKVIGILSDRGSRAEALDSIIELVLAQEGEESDVPADYQAAGIARMLVLRDNLSKRVGASEPHTTATRHAAHGRRRGGPRQR